MGDYAYKRISDDFRCAIESGELAVGSKLPTTTELCDRYGVSRITVKRAMDELTHAGLIMRRRGAGTFVSDTPATPETAGVSWDIEDRSLGYAAECAARGKVAHARVLVFQTVYPTHEAREALALQESEVCHRIERTLFADDTPEAVVCSFIPWRIAPDLTREDAARSLFAYATDELHLAIARSLRKISATPAAAEAARELGIAVGAPVLRIVQTSFIDDGRAFEYSEAIHYPDYRYSATRRP